MNDARRQDILDIQIGLKICLATLRDAKGILETATEEERKAASNRPLPLLYSELAMRSDDALHRMGRLMEAIQALQLNVVEAAKLAGVIIRGEPM